jgi:Tfp pilus assembly protein PilF
LNQAIGLGLDTLYVHLELGNVHLARSDWKAALAEYAKCVDIDDKNPVAAFNYGLVLRKMGDIEGAVGFYTRALELDPKFREPMLELAVLHLQNHKPDEALRALERADHDGVVLSLIGAAYLQKNDLDHAQSFLERALRKDRSLSDARLNLAEVYTRKGDHVRAARYVQSVGAK